MTTHVRTFILGGGMSGLSCAYHLKDNYLLIERSDEPGGLSRSIKQDGFVFDHTGHLLHLRNPYTLKLIPELLGDNLVLNQRRAWIYSHHVYTRYPYQANLYGLPKKVIEENLKGVVEAQIRQAPAPASQPESLHSWVLRTFGKGFAKHFFFPYNEKLWSVPADVLTAEWVAPFVPKPSIQEVINGAFSDQTKKFGYNASFYYPKEGGIQALAFAFAKNLPNIRLNTSVSAIDIKQKTATLSTGESVSYDFLVNTAPLNRFMDMTQGLPGDVAGLRKLMRASSVYDINLGVKRAHISDKHWIYYPEKKYRFYRVGFPMNFSTHMTPPECSSMYVEIAYRPEETFDESRAMKDAIRGLLDCGLLKSESEIITRNILRIPCAYVTYDNHRTRLTEQILRYLDSQRTYSIGRFGGWKYSYMEEAILEGMATAEKNLGAMTMDTPDRKLRVAHIITQLELGGAQRNTLYTVNHLNPEHYEPLLICGPGGILDKEAKKGKGAYFVRWLVRPLRPWKDAVALGEIYYRLRQVNPHIVHTHSSKAGILGRIAAYLAGVPVIIHTFHGFGFNNRQKPWTRWLFITLEKLCAPLSTHLIFVSEENRKEAAHLRIGKKVSKSLIRSGIQLSPSPKQPRVERDNRAANTIERALKGIPNDAWRVAYVGNFKPQKNPMDLARVALEVIKQKPNTHFLLAGEGELQTQVADWCKEQGILAQVHFLGWCKRYDDVQRILAASHCFLLTSLWEGLPRSLVEAFVAGKPAVAYGVDGVRDILIDEETGFLIPPENVQLAAEKIIWLSEHPEKAAKMGEKARERITKEFDIDLMVRQQEDLYKHLYEAVPLKSYYEPLWVNSSKL